MTKERGDRDEAIPGGRDQSIVHSPITSIYPSLTKSEKKVAGIVLKDPETAVFYTITDLSKHAEVGDTSVIRSAGSSGIRAIRNSSCRSRRTWGPWKSRYRATSSQGMIWRRSSRS
ncbi:hypothetical protein WJ0W_000093 [Paenibacillus melissococcoides]|uniref:HTH rpiR-type domain-containing protein n=1 Tax=Paenibacillus melissococcoides TaxID=2912268 RepID=A0ABM9FUS9_9BACL|nr:MULTISPECIES: hypothetical protein [Paenibacillus]MEB9896665.1 hypothetical protein [Bacillus cereus]CAH8242884.1 hypothetical protein WJ0W_000093 [Paenibacillus melissococcoides]CAH8703327.1 hypothetical protein WDD9_000091 [Paenibacillus melissococcoides]CAH8706150.1 hypothetical protein HTL2_001175 [Paenibacillus melissococcoides]